MIFNFTCRDLQRLGELQTELAGSADFCATYLRCQLLLTKVNTNILHTNTFIQQNYIKLIRSDCKTFITKNSFSNKCFSSEFSVHQRILKKKIIIVFTKIWSSTTDFNIVSWAANQHNDFWRIWSNDTENSQKKTVFLIKLWPDFLFTLVFCLDEH